ncbi:helicase-related protein [Actinomyces sp.]|uniref:helicase-related protein n=1 Tax=Actinomyces sp. TaxID=29317 RepID=UPI0026DAD042|nr:helicase-related protein [Actinomyces sp.]MDO4899178.1 helicase-related protein [Actinomyces sp.]
MARIEMGDRLSVAASVFSMYAYRELAEQLEGLEEFRFIFTSDAFTTTRPKREKREFYIPRLSREQGLFGTQFEIKLRNELTQKAVASECADWIRRKARFKSFSNDGHMDSFLEVRKPEDDIAYLPFDEFTTSKLGTERGESGFSTTMRLDASQSRECLRNFDEAWESGQLQDVTDAVIDSISTMYAENAPELVYYAALYRIFNEFLDDISDDVLPNEGTGFQQSAIWGKLYDFQRDAALAIINKLETYDGCILADSVGLGKTFTALAVIKYYESRNRNVLVLCPKKLKDNWLTYNQNLVNNPIAADRLRYDVLYHTDMSRDRGMSETGIPLDRINWGAYDLVVIDESHNFRNGADTASKNDDRENRYQRLLARVIQEGVRTKVLMLSATPVNNRFRDLRNQLALAYAGDGSKWEGRLRLDNDIETVFRNAQVVFTRWSKLPPDQRTTLALTRMLDFEFFEVLDQVTVARSRKHIQRHYDMQALGPFPRRNKPISKRPHLSTMPGAISYHEIYEELEDLSLAIYIPSQYLHQSKVSKYAGENGGNLTMAGRETGLRKLMNANLLKRLESSVWSFRMTLERILGYMSATLEVIDAYKVNRSQRIVVEDTSSQFDFDLDDEEMFFEVGGKTKIDLEDMDWLSWERDIAADVETINVLLSMIKDIDPAHDAKLVELCDQLRGKVEAPINPGNKKVMIFTAFADTAEYLYEHVSAFAKRELGLETAVVTGTRPGSSTIKQIPADMGSILACFSPVSKERAVVAKQLEGHDIDILIATDCISEGQNLQDCDYLINYDIHWNPVRIVQRFGRIDRIGSKNDVIQLVNYWPDIELDEYIKLKARVEERMRITVMTSTGDDDYINEEEKGDLEYRERQLRQMQEEVIDLEDVSGGVSITDLGLNDFRMDLVVYYKANPEVDRLPSGIHAVVAGDEPGVIFVLRNVNPGVNIQGRNHLHPFYLVYVKDDGEVLHGHLDPKDALDAMRLLCRGKSEPDAALCKAFNRETKNGRDMRRQARLLKDAVGSIIEAKAESDIDSFFAGGTTSFLENDVEGLDDFELVCFLAVRQC